MHNQAWFLVLTTVGFCSWIGILFVFIRYLQGYKRTLAAYQKSQDADACKRAVFRHSRTAALWSGILALVATVSCAIAAFVDTFARWEEFLEYRWFVPYAIAFCVFSAVSMAGLFLVPTRLPAVLAAIAKFFHRFTRQ